MEKPILFSGEMVRAILDGRKTQTRRAIPRAGGGYLGHIPERNTHWFGLDLRTVGNSPETSIEVKCPYGRPGDLLWVRETWACFGAEHVKPSEIAPGYSVYYAADERLAPEKWPDGLWNVDKWRPSIFMPRWASRLTLLVLDVRVERVQDITPSGYRKEGICLNYDARMNSLHVEPLYKRRWVELWDSINAKRGYPWDSNPWVWVVEFEAVQ